MLAPLLLLTVEGESALEGRCVERDKECDDCMGVNEKDTTHVCAVSGRLTRWAGCNEGGSTGGS